MILAMQPILQADTVFIAKYAFFGWPRTIASATLSSDELIVKDSNGQVVYSIPTSSITSAKCLMTTSVLMIRTDTQKLNLFFGKLLHSQSNASNPLMEDPHLAKVWANTLNELKNNPGSVQSPVDTNESAYINGYSPRSVVRAILLALVAALFIGSFIVKHLQ